ncbi:alpha/beta hydrolase-fold protein [Colwelliaceae bacterium 6441]
MTIVRNIICTFLLIFGQPVALASNDVQSLEVKSEEMETLSVSTTLNIKSNVLSEERKVLVHLPEGYKESNKAYPVLYLLDGNRHLPHAILSSQILHQESLIPEMIIVAITNNRGTRTRDLSTNKVAFSKFIEDELFPVIQSRYRTSAIKTLFGHSMAGYFATNILADTSNMFNNYIAASPVLQINEAHIVETFNQLQMPNISERSIYFTLTDAVVEGKAAGDAMTSFVANLTSSDPKGLNWSYDFIPNQVHMTTPYITLYEGLTFVFSDFQAPKIASLQDYEALGGMAGLNKHYALRSEKYSVNNVIPERTLRRIGFTILDDGHSKEALIILETNATKNPNSLRALNALGTAYQELQQNQKAIEVYSKALALAKKLSSPAQKRFEREIKKISGLL